MDATLAIINELESRGIIERYAIGGAIGLLFYTEPVLSYDLDIFCFLPVSPGNLVSLTPIYDYLRGIGCQEDREHIIISGIPVQFIPAYNPLIVEAVQMAVQQQFKSVPTRVLRYEHLLAIMAQTDRSKDRVRLAQVLEERKPDEEFLRDLLGRHGLLARWQARGG